jgi:hypothetical protein
MEVELKNCIIYVDYEGLLVGLSYMQYLEIDPLLGDLLQKARQRFHIQHAIVLGDWSRYTSRPLLESQGYTCLTASGTAQEINREIQQSIDDRLSVDKEQATEVYILVGGKDERTSLLRQINGARSAGILWTLVPPTPTEQALCSEWEIIALPDTAKARSWPRPVMLQAVALAADHLQSDAKTPFLLRDLLDLARQFKPLNQTAHIWLNIAVREQIIVLLEPETEFDLLSGSLNRQHSVVQSALFARDRILMTMKAMLVNRDWVAFSALEKALRTNKALADSQSYRHGWLELLVDAGVLVSRPVPRPDESYTVTTLRFNEDHRAIAMLADLQQRNLQRLIISISDFVTRKDHHQVASARLQQKLMKAMTYIEARTTISTAFEGGIIRNGSATIPEQVMTSQIALRLDSSHPFVKKTLAQRDQLILLSDSILTQRNSQVSEDVMAEEFAALRQMGEDESFFWIRLFEEEGIFLLNRMSSITTLRIKYSDAVVKQALDQVG